MTMKNRQAFLDMIAASELTLELMKISDNGYNVLAGATAKRPLVFLSYADHPRIYNKQLNSTAAGRYQLLAHNYDYYKRLLSLPDFSPASQDSIALWQIGECHALHNIDAGRIRIAIAECSRIWASLPGNGYKQHQNGLELLCSLYQQSGGAIA